VIVFREDAFEEPGRSTPAAARISGREIDNVELITPELLTSLSQVQREIRFLLLPAGEAGSADPGLDRRGTVRAA
jgi:hypothetical protein